MKMPKLEEIFITVAIACHRYERLAVLEMFLRLFCFEQVKALKNFSGKLYTSLIKEERRSKDEK